MNIISIIMKEVKQNFRNKKAMIMMILFPVVLIVVLGTALSGVFGKSVDIGTPKVLYCIKNNGQAADNFKSNFIDRGKDYNIKFTKTDDIEAAKKKLINSNDYACVIVMNSETNIQVYNNDKDNIGGGIVDSFLSNYAQRYNALAEIVKVNPSGLKDAVENNKTDYSYVSSIDKKHKPSSLNYYAIAEVALIIMYAAMTGIYSVSAEKNTKTRDRILLGPVRKYEFLLGKTFGGVIATTLQIVIVLLFSKYVLNINFGTDIFTIIIVLISQIIMAVSVGVGVGFIFKNENIAGGILNFLIPVMVFLGGSYAPVDNMGNKTFTDIITYISPVRWVNQSIFGVIYSNNYSKVGPTILINILIAIVFLAIASWIFRKESA